MPASEGFGAHTPLPRGTAALPLVLVCHPVGRLLFLQGLFGRRCVSFALAGLLFAGFDILCFVCRLALACLLLQVGLLVCQPPRFLCFFLLT